MTAPAAPPILAGGGRSVTVGHNAVLLTEYAPVTVINTSSSSRVYLATDSNISQIGAVPLDPGTSFYWKTAGPLYAVLDTAASDPSVALVLTGAGSDWSPSPVAIGAAIAAQLLATGVPTTALSVVLGNYSTPAGAGVSASTPIYTSKGFQQISVNLVGSNGNQTPSPLIQFGITWLNDAAGTVVTGYDEIYTLTTTVNQFITAPVQGDYFFISIMQGSSSNISRLTIRATTRPADRFRIHYGLGGQTAVNTALLYFNPTDYAVGVSGSAAAQTYVFPVEGTVQVNFTVPALTGTNAQLQIVMDVVALTPTESIVVRTMNTYRAAGYYSFNLTAPNQVLKLSMLQNGTAAIRVNVAALRIPV